MARFLDPGRAHGRATAVGGRAGRARRPIGTPIAAGARPGRGSTGCSIG